MESSEAKTVDDRLRKAGIVAAGAAGWLFLVFVVQMIVSAVAFATSPGLYGLNFVEYLLLDIPYRLGAVIVPVAIGLFIAWGFVVRITADLDLRGVAVRSVLSALLASAVYFIIAMAIDVVVATSFDRSLFADSFPNLLYDGADVVTVLVSSVQRSVALALDILPLGVLGGIVLWHWLRRDAPTREGVV